MVPQEQAQTAAPAPAGLLGRLSVRLIGESAWIAAGQFVTALSGLVGVRVLTELLEPAEYGRLGLAVTLVTFAQQIIFSPLSGAALRFLSLAREEGQTAAFAAALTRRGVFFALLLCGLAVPLGVVLAVREGSVGVLLTVAALVYALSSGVAGVADGLQIADRHRAVVAMHQGGGNALRFLCASVLTLVAGRLGAVALAGYAVATIAVALSQLRLLRPTLPRHEIVRDEDRLTWHRRIRDYSWPMMTWGGFTWAQLASDRWSLSTAGHASDVGLYVALWQVGVYPITMLANLAVQLVAPIVFAKVGDGASPERLAWARRFTWRLVWLACGLTFGAAVVAWAAHDLVFALLVGPAYRSVSAWLPLMVVAAGLVAAAQAAYLYALSAEHTRELLAPKIGTAIIGTVASIAGAFVWGLPGVIVAQAVFGAVSLLWAMFLLARG